MVDFTWTRGKWTYSAFDPSRQLKVRDENGQEVEVQQVPVQEAKRTLGVYLAPDGSNDQMKEALLNKAKEWAEQIRVGHLGREESWRALKTTIMKSIEYPLLSSTFSDKDLRDIMRPVLKQGLSQSGIANTFPRAVVYSSQTFLGLGLKDPYTTQTIKHLGAIVTYMESACITGQLLRQNWELMQLEIGVAQPMQEISYKHFEPLMTQNWIQRAWQSADVHNIVVFQEKPSGESLLRENDKYFMEVVIPLRLDSKILQAVNRSRLYLRLLTTSDILTGDGKFIRHLIWKGEREFQYGWDENWPVQGEPSKNDWTQWRRILKQVFDIQAPSREILADHWIGDGSCPVDWQWFYSRADDRVYRSRGDQVLVYSILRTGRRTRLKKYTLSAATKTLPSDLCPCTIDFIGSPSTLRMTGYWMRHQVQAFPSLVDTPLSEYIQTLDVNASWPFQDTILPLDGGKTLSDAIKNGTLWICADGSFLQEMELGTASFQLVDRVTNDRWKGSLRTPGLARFQSAYRSELAGVSAGTIAASFLITRFGIQEGQIYIGCDSDTALEHSIDLSYRLSASTKHYDLLRITHHYLKSSPQVQWIPTRVQGHADDDDRELTYMEELNVECDRMAKHKLSELAVLPASQFDPQLQHSGCMVKCEGWRIPTDFQAVIYDHIHQDSILSYWEQRREDMNQSVHWAIDWTSAGMAMKGISTKKQIWLYKHLIGRCAVGTVMVRRGERKHSECPRCGHPEEDVRHIIICHDNDAQTIWKAQLSNLRTWLQKRITHPKIVSTILAGLRMWHRGAAPLSPSDPQWQTKCLYAQNAIG